ncbi:hypothetical protein [Synechococcus sp. MIT S1220]|uniref:hypothetical protein n=1 Tax=Synechococcus sp. MIT S1220 TaxID=3082549 RepID=UPI0039AEEA7B
MAFSRNSNGPNSDSLVRLGGLWRNEGKGGKTYLAGSFGGARLMIFPNGFKEKDSDPDYVLCIAQSQPKKEKAEPNRTNDFPI